MSLTTVTVTPGAGAGILVDDVGTGKTQVIKLDVGAVGVQSLLGTSTPLPASLYQQRSSTQGLTWVKLDSAAGGNIDLVAAVASQFIRVYAWWFTVAGVVTVQFGDGTVTFTGAQTFGAGGGMIADPIIGPNGMEPRLITAAVNRPFRIIMGGAIQI